MKKLSIACFILYIMFQNISAQNGGAKKCINAEPLCGSTLFSYPNTSGINFVDNNADYGCLTVPVNPAWFYFQIANDGGMQLKISQATDLNGASDLDVDFVAYGPFDNPQKPCESDLLEANIVDCSFETAYVEYLDIANANAGEYYLLLITNFSTEPGFITVEQTFGTATTNCNFLLPPEIINLKACSGDTLILDATTENANYYEWFKESTEENGSFELKPNFNANSLDVFESETFKVKVYDDNHVYLKEIIFNPTFYEIPKIPEIISDYVICLDDAATDEFNLKSKNTEILNGLDANIFSVSYFIDEDKATLGINPLPDIYVNSSSTEIIYARVENIQSAELTCNDIKSFLLVKDEKPQTKLNDSYVLCLNTNGTESVTTPPVIETNLSPSEYTFDWYLDDALLPDENQGFIIPKIGGQYSVIISRKTNNCSSVFETEVITSSPPVAEASVISNPFTESNTIEIRVQNNSGNNDYAYRLDNGDWQNDNRFNNVSLGEHLITVLDPQGCGETTITTMVMDYPLFFTPNGDGQNDTWNIVGMPTNWTAKVSIFDRYGKLIKQIVPNNSGWDGTFNGNQLPSDDYWFYLEYVEPNKNSNQIFKSHFTLKR